MYATVEKRNAYHREWMRKRRLDPKFRDHMKQYRIEYEMRPEVIARRATPDYLKREKESAKKKYALSKEKRRGYNASPRGRWRVYVSSAKAKNLDFTLSRDQFAELILSPCHYCGDKGGGIDRKDNIKGYTPENSLSACSVCNHAKATLSYEDFISLCRKIVETHNS